LHDKIVYTTTIECEPHKRTFSIRDVTQQSYDSIFKLLISNELQESQKLDYKKSINIRSRPLYDERYKRQYNREPPKNVKSSSKIYKKTHFIWLASL